MDEWSKGSIPAKSKTSEWFDFKLIKCKKFDLLFLITNFRWKEALKLLELEAHGLRHGEEWAMDSVEA